MVTCSVNTWISRATSSSRQIPRQTLCSRLPRRLQHVHDLRRVLDRKRIAAAHLPAGKPFPDEHPADAFVLARLVTGDLEQAGAKFRITIVDPIFPRFGGRVGRFAVTDLGEADRLIPSLAGRV